MTSSSIVFGSTEVHTKFDSLWKQVLVKCLYCLIRGNRSTSQKHFIGHLMVALLKSLIKDFPAELKNTLSRNIAQTHLSKMLHLYRNQSIYLHSKSIDWLPHEWHIGRKQPQDLFIIINPHQVNVPLATL